MIIHIAKRENPYVMIDKRMIEDGALSWKAKGILAYLLSKPPGWIVMRQDIVNHSSDGLDSVQSGMQELKELGYAALINAQGEDGKTMGKRWVVAERPELLSEAIPSAEKTVVPNFPCAENPHVGEIGTVSNNDSCSKNELSKTNESTSPPLFPELEPEHPLAVHATEVRSHLAIVKEEREGEALAIYEEYPKKVGKLAAIREIKKALKLKPFHFLLMKTKHYAICRVAKDPQFTYKPETFFKDGHYDDDETEWTTTGSQQYRRQLPTSGVVPAKPVMSGDERRQMRLSKV